MTTETGASTEDVLKFVMDERAHCVSDREWKHRLRGYGYDIRQTNEGQVLTTLLKGEEVCTLAA